MRKVIAAWSRNPLLQWPGSSGKAAAPAVPREMCGCTFVPINTPRLSQKEISPALRLS